MTLLCLSVGMSLAQDSLKLYNPDIPLVQLPTTNTLYAMRIDLPQPLSVKKIKLRLSGSSSDGELKVRVLGHEAGTSFPQLEKTLFGPYTVKKTKSGYEEVEVELDEGAYFSNNQFFILLSDWSDDVHVMAEASAAEASCNSSSGGNYYNLFAKNGSGQWVLINRKAVAADLLVEYEQMPSETWMKDVTELAGIDKTLRNKSIAVGELNGDDFLDLIIDGHVYFNQGGFKFKDVSSTFGHATTGLVANAIIDMNNDGLVDILLLYTDSMQHTLLMNQGNGQYTKKRLEVPIPVRGISSFSIADIDRDGFPDLFVGRLWTMYPSSGPDIVANYLYLNDGQGSFSEASDMIYPIGWKHRRSRGSAWCDYDNDGDLDLFVANYYLEPDELWRNNGDGTFTDVAHAKGIDVNSKNQSSHGTGCDWGDFNNDGTMDLLLPMLAHPGFTLQYDHLPTTLYRNGGAPDFQFYNETAKSGIEYEETHAGGAWADIDNDGLLDFAISTFYGCRYIDLYRQTAKGKFEIVTGKYGMEGLVSGEDACWADLDNDGKLDLLMGESGKVRVFKNDIPVWHHHYVSIQLESDKENKQAIGSRVEVYAGGRRMTRDITAGRGVRMQQPARVHVGLGESQKIDSVRVRWYGDTSYTRIQGIKADHLNYVNQNGHVKLNTNTIQEIHEFKVWPNPSNGSLYLESNKDEYVVLYNTAGVKLGSWKLGANVQLQLDLHLSPGIYLIRGSSGIQKRVIFRQ